MSVSLRPSSARLPKYCRQRRKGKPDRAFVKLGGKRISLGQYGTPESRARYAELISKSTEGGSRLRPSTDPSVSELILAYLEHAVEYYRNDAGKPSREYEQQREAMRHLRRHAGATLAREFGPRRLQEIRQEWIDENLTRKHINSQVRRITVAFRWAVSQEMIPAATYQALTSVKGLRKGRGKGRDSKVVRPVDAEAVVTFPRF